MRKPSSLKLHYDMQIRHRTTPSKVCTIGNGSIITAGNSAYENPPTQLAAVLLTDILLITSCSRRDKDEIDYRSNMSRVMRGPALRMRSSRPLSVLAHIPAATSSLLVRSR